MMRRQFRVLYRDFLFRIVDRELLSTYATGDASQLLLQLVALLAFLSVLFLGAGPGHRPDGPVQVRLMFAWSVEHFLIATTMLVVGIFSVLSWDSMFPGHRDVLVLGPLPIRAHTILLAKLAAVVTALSLAVVTLHVVSGVVWPLALNASARGHAVGALALTMDPAIPPVAAADLQLALDRDLADAVRNGPLAPGAGGGVAIGVYQRGVRRVFAYGAAAPNSVFPIASVTKPFTGLVLATMVQEQVVRFDEPVRELIPAARLPAPLGREITLLDLATHRSGLPGMPATFHPANPANPFADFDVSKLYAYLARRGVGRPPVSRFTYSNLGFGLLGHALSHSRRRRLRHARSRGHHRTAGNGRHGCRALAGTATPAPAGLQRRPAVGSRVGHRRAGWCRRAAVHCAGHAHVAGSQSPSGASALGHAVGGAGVVTAGPWQSRIRRWHRARLDRQRRVWRFSARRRDGRLHGRRVLQPTARCGGHRVVERGDRDLGVRGCSRRAHSRPSERRACSVDRRGRHPGRRRSSFRAPAACGLLGHDARGRRVHLRPRHERAGSRRIAAPAPAFPACVVAPAVGRILSPRRCGTSSVVRGEAGRHPRQRNRAECSHHPRPTGSSVCFRN